MDKLFNFSSLVSILTKETGMDIPFVIINIVKLRKRDVLKPLYNLVEENYHLKIRLGYNDSKYIVSVSDLDGRSFNI